MSELIAVLRSRTTREAGVVTRLWLLFITRAKIVASYRVQFALDVLGIVLSTLQYYFLAFLVSPAELARLGYGTSYFVFAVIGIACSRYVWMLTGAVVNWVWHDIMAQTLAAVVATRTDVKLYFLSHALWAATWASLWFVGVIAVALPLGFTAKLSLAGVASLVLVLVLLVVVHAAIGILFGAIAVKHKQVDVLSFLLAALIDMLGGVIYPLSVLRKYEPLYYVALCLPFTHALECARAIVIRGATLASPELLPHVVALLASLVLVPLAFRAVDHYVRLALRDGDLFAY